MINIADQKHPDYSIYSPIWKRCRDSFDGEDAIKDRGVLYLPKLKGQSEDDYDAYKLRARFYNAFRKTVKGFVGLATRKPAVLVHPEGFEDNAANINRSGADIHSYIKSVIEETLKVNRSATLVDFDRMEEGATLADAKGKRPYWIHYKAEDIMDWAYREGKLISVLFREVKPDKETAVVDEGDKYRYRLCELDESGNYIQKLYKNGNSDQPEVITPTANGGPLKEIPVVIHQDSFKSAVEPSPLLDLVNMCLSHYRLKADHAHALHYVALPTPWVTGVDSSDASAPKTIGPQTLWLIADPSARVGMLEVSGQGLQAIENELKSMEEHMAIFGVRVLLPEISENTATASLLRSISETSDLSTIVGVVEKQLDKLLKLTVEWGGHKGESSLSIDKNFMPKEMDAQMITALVAAWNAGSFDFQNLIYNLKKAEIVPSERDMDEIIKNVDAEDEERTVKAAEALKNMESGSDEDA
ncbi:MAG: DUF4055 domain-containing protein [Planctomycetes bacterium]|nr:DUF4055 domain-containing protein [Planctomycetota bacterium]